MKIKRSIRFNLIKLKDIEDDIRIRMRVTYLGNRVEFPLSGRTSFVKWDPDSELVLPRYEDKFGNTFKDINKEIENYRDTIDKVFAKYELVEDRIPTINEVKNDFNELLGKSVKREESRILNIQDVGELFLKANKVAWTDNTYKNMVTMLNHLRAFDDTLDFNDIDSKLLNKYSTFLIENQNLQNSTTKKQIKTFKWFLNWAYDNNYQNSLEHKKFRLKLKTVEQKVIFLTWDELMKVYNLRLANSQKYLDRVRDVFCFCCFTSLRHSDVYNLKRSDITDNTIELVTVKTIDNISIDLNDYSRAILDKYKEIPSPKNKALPVISNQKMNDYLKELGELAGLDSKETIVYYKGNERKEMVVPKYKLLSTHCGRRTFICNALALGIPPHVVMKWTGHSDYATMKPYIEVADNTKSESMLKFNIPNKLKG